VFLLLGGGMDNKLEEKQEQEEDFKKTKDLFEKVRWLHN
jgi:hypothetical protein